MAQTVIGMFDDANQARQAAQQLESMGVTRDHIDISAQNTTGTTSASTTSSTTNDDSISGFFRSLFTSDDEVSRYSEVARRGAMVTVHASDQMEAQRAAEVLDRCGAVDVDERAQQYRSGWTGMGAQSMSQQSMGQQQNLTAGTDATASGTSSRDMVGRGADVTDQSIPIIEENLQVGKREVETGAMRLRSRIVERPVEEHLRLRQEHAWIERNPVNRPASEADIQNFREGEIEITERAEVPVVNKEARVVEEVRLGKEVEERDETIRDTVRRTDVDVERLNSDDPMRQRRASSDQDDLNRGSGL
ncbi:YsnF/AvaK domain-containing protein [Hymenobacter latericus]|uniref:YsnF/AvaK domain-containing protein n=1 Tax=Hymenobacter sp. YIM 151858-1 TaxID=2987688 RepID=UPI002226AF92|nr:YsnF/AvaK domain-containing protein [Hymenobacter sp. YIM 151858-1]UYZ59502.1 YsnF/AvaK domain-containing protein [Hymenobacter sp. YIM 151858-1]